MFDLQINARGLLWLAATIIGLAFAAAEAIPWPLKLLLGGLFALLVAGDALAWLSDWRHRRSAWFEIVMRPASRGVPGRREMVRAVQRALPDLSDRLREMAGVTVSPSTSLRVLNLGLMLELRCADVPAVLRYDTRQLIVETLGWPGASRWSVRPHSHTITVALLSYGVGGPAGLHMLTDALRPAWQDLEAGLASGDSFVICFGVYQIVSALAWAWPLTIDDLAAVLSWSAAPTAGVLRVGLGQARLAFEVQRVRGALAYRVRWDAGANYLAQRLLAGWLGRWQRVPALPKWRLEQRRRNAPRRFKRWLAGLNLPLEERLRISAASLGFRLSDRDQAVHATWTSLLAAYHQQHPGEALTRAAADQLLAEAQRRVEVEMD